LKKKNIKMPEKITKIDTWHRIEDDGSGDYYLVPEGLFELSIEESYDIDPDFYEKMKKCHYIGGFASCVQIRGEFK